MISVVQGEDKLIGSAEAILELSKKDHARILVCSDSHGKVQILDSILRNFGRECDAFVFCGDGAGDVCQILSNLKNDKVLQNCVPPVVAVVRGNGDSSFYKVAENQTVYIPDSQILNVNNRSFMIVHGHTVGVDFGFENYGLQMQIEHCPVGFYGHTHVAREDNEGGYKFVNPGSCARPRGGQPPCFAIATVEKNFVDVAFIRINSITESDKPFSVWNPIY